MITPHEPRAPNDEARAVAAAPSFRGLTTAGSGQYGTNAADREIFQTVQIRAEQAGCALYQLADGQFLLAKWNLSKTCPDLRAVRALLSRLTSAAS